MCAQFVANGFPQRSRAAAVHDPHVTEPRDRGVVDNRPNRFAGLLRREPANVDLMAGIDGRRRIDAHSRCGTLAASSGRPQARERDSNALARVAVYLRLVARDPSDHAADAERRRFHRIADRERGYGLHRLERAKRALGSPGTGARSAEVLIADTFCAAGSRSLFFDLALATARIADMPSKRGELRARLGEIGFRLRDRALPFGVG